MASIIDMRSDTVTKPTAEMRRAMAEAIVGDDVYGEDPTVIRLQNKMASILGKESGLFFPSGTMSNLAAVMAHANERGDEVLLGDRSHISVWEQGSISNLGGVFARHVRNLPDGTLDLDDLQSKIHKGGIDGHYTNTKAILIENTHNYCGGIPIPLEHMEALKTIANDKGLKIHVDGARIFNAATALKVSPAELVQHADTVNVCLSKGLGAPVGSILVGPKEVIDKCHRIRKALGGGMRQVGVLAAAGLVAMETIPLLVNDHTRAKRLGAELASMKEYGITLDTNKIHTNIILFSFQRSDLPIKRFLQLLATPTQDNEVCVKMDKKEGSWIRAALHHQVNDEDIDKTIDKLRQVLSKKY